MLKLYNTLSRKKEIFKPKKGKRINLFVCGPTVYDFSHIGHARTYVVFDVIVKYLRQKGYNVFYLQNITDIDNKIIERARRENVSWKKLARKFEKEYLKDIKALNINSVTKYARATDHIKEIISQVKRLLEKNYAYQIGDGIYYDISEFKDYGKLSKRTAIMAEDAVSRIDEAKEKRNKGDFCLWKFSKKGEPRWKSPWFSGRPGWHIEDTAITEKYFGAQYDIHGGAKELIFPHHEAEIAQMEAISERKPLVRHWLHTGLLTIKGVKMAKSLGNFITIRDFLKQHSVRILRLFILKSHYRSPIDYTEEEIEQIKKQLERIDEFIDKLQRSDKFSGDRTKSGQNLNSKKGFAKSLILRTQKEFERAMEDDFNTAKAIASVFNLINKGNSLIAQNKLCSFEARDILELLRRIDRVFNFIFWKKPKREKIPARILKLWNLYRSLRLVKVREQYRWRGDWQKADEIRRKIRELGYQIEDTKKGPKIRRKFC